MILDCNDEDVDLICYATSQSLPCNSNNILRSGLTNTCVFLVLKAQVYRVASV